MLINDQMTSFFNLSFLNLDSVKTTVLKVKIEFIARRTVSIAALHNDTMCLPIKYSLLEVSRLVGESHKKETGLFSVLL